MKFGVQLFGVLKDQPGRTMEVLKSLAEAGICEVEPCLSIKPIPGLEHVIWSFSWLEEHFSKIRSMGLEIRSVHLMTPLDGTCLKALKKLAKQIGIKHVVVKTPRQLTDEAFQEAALNYMSAADQLSEAGVKLLLHNEGTDITNKKAGKTAYEHLLDLCLGKVYAQVDVGWVLFAGEDPAAFLWRNAGRVYSLHYKDYAADHLSSGDVSIGTGSLDLKSCVVFARAWNIPQILDQEHFGADLGKEIAQICERIDAVKMNWENTNSYVHTYDIETGLVHTLRKFDFLAESPNWLRDGRMLLDGKGKLFWMDPKTGETTPLDTGDLCEFGNAHVLSPDEQWIGASCGFKETFVYLIPAGGGTVRRVSENSPCYFHGWSPDGKNLVYLGMRDDKNALDIYRIPTEGGQEEQLTHGGYQDGPEYSPDGEYIWYNSNITGTAQIWRMKADGSEKTQMTASKDRNNMFPHISPDGKKVVYTAYAFGCLKNSEHLPDIPMELWMMNSDGSDNHRILSFFGGHGAMHVNSWSPDSRSFAFVSYELKI